MKYIVLFRPVIGDDQAIGSFDTREEAENCLRNFRQEAYLKRNWYRYNSCYISEMGPVPKSIWKRA